MNNKIEPPKATKLHTMYVAALYFVLLVYYLSKRPEKVRDCLGGEEEGVEYPSSSLDTPLDTPLLRLESFLRLYLSVRKMLSFTSLSLFWSILSSVFSTLIG